MKRLVITLATVLISIIGSAQVKVENTTPYFDVQFKRAILKGTSLYVDLLFINTSKYDTLIQLQPGMIIDDEGNRYAKWYTEDNKGSLYELTVPSGITQKLRFIIKNVDEFATKFQVIDFQTFICNDIVPSWRGGAFGQLRLRDIPIVKE